MARSGDSQAHVLLSAIPVFSGLNVAERQLLQQFSLVRVFKPGQVIFQEGDTSKDVAFIAIGLVKIVKASASRRVIVRIVGGGEPVGIVAALESRPYPAGAIALTPATIVQIPERDFLALLGRHPEIIRQLLRCIMCRQVELGCRLTEMTGVVETRLARVLVDLARQCGFEGDGAGEIPLPLTRQDIADLAGTTPETVIRIMSRWGKSGFVLSTEEGFRVPSLKALSQIAER